MSVHSIFSALKMENQRRIRYFVIFVSLIIFCYQVNTALYNVMSDDTVDSTEYINISNLESPPVITVCPRQSINKQILQEWGYKGHAYILLSGKLIAMPEALKEFSRFQDLLDRFDPRGIQTFDPLYNSQAPSPLLFYFVKTD